MKFEKRKLELEDAIDECELAIDVARIAIQEQPIIAFVLFIPVTILLIFTKIAKWAVAEEKNAK